MASDKLTFKSISYFRWFIELVWVSADLSFNSNSMIVNSSVGWFETFNYVVTIDSLSTFELAFESISNLRWFVELVWISLNI